MLLLFFLLYNDGFRLPAQMMAYVLEVFYLLQVQEESLH